MTTTQVPTPPRCDGCKFWEPDADTHLGKCRRFPPAAPATAGGFATGGGVGLLDLPMLWPATEPADWCGEWAA